MSPDLQGQSRDCPGYEEESSEQSNIPTFCGIYLLIDLYTYLQFTKNLEKWGNIFEKWNALGRYFP